MDQGLKELLDEARGQVFQAGAVYSEDGDFLTLYTCDVDCYSERVDDTLTLYKEDETDEIVGFKLKGLSRLLRNIEAQGLVIQSESETRMTVLFMSWMTASKPAKPGQFDVLHYLWNEFGGLTVQLRNVRETQEIARLTGNNHHQTA